MSKHHQKLSRVRWGRLRIATLKEANWRCSVCNAYAREVDHIVPLENGGPPYDPENLQVLCRDCHKAKTREENRNPLTPEQEEWETYLRDLLSRG